MNDLTNQQWGWVFLGLIGVMFVYKLWVDLVLPHFSFRTKRKR